MGQRGGLTNLCIVGRCLACAEMGSCVQLNMSIQCFGVCLSHTDTYTHFILQCLPPPCGGKTTAAATDLSFQAVTKERPPSVPGQQKYHLFRPSKESARRPYTKSAKLSEIFAHFLFGWNVFCVPVNLDVTMNVPLCLGTTAGRCPVSWHTTY